MVESWAGGSVSRLELLRCRTQFRTIFVSHCQEFGDNLTNNSKIHCSHVRRRSDPFMHLCFHDEFQSLDLTFEGEGITPISLGANYRVKLEH